MTIRYKEEKATQAAISLLNLDGGQMNHMKLIKLLYLADRLALIQWGRPITFDGYVSMPHGPVLSFTLDLINSQPDTNETTYWHRYISERNAHQVSVLSVSPNDQLSRAEEELLAQVYSEFGHLSQWDLRDYTHKLPEWHDPKGSSHPIDIREILLSGGHSEEDIQEIIDALEAEATATQLLE